jgi:hypothetical protein
LIVCDWKKKWIQLHFFDLPDGSRLGLTTSLEFDSNLELIFTKKNEIATSIYVEVMFHMNKLKLYSPISTPTRLNPGRLVTPITFMDIDRSYAKNPNFEMSFRVSLADFESDGEPGERGTSIPTK